MKFLFGFHVIRGVFSRLNPRSQSSIFECVDRLLILMKGVDQLLKSYFIAFLGALGYYCTLSSS